MFKIKIKDPNKLNICKEIEDNFPVIVNKDSIQIQRAKVVLDVMHFLLLNDLYEDKFEVEIEEDTYFIKDIDDYSHVRNDVEGLWAKEIEDHKTIFNSSISNDDRRKLLEKVNKQSRFYQSYEQYLKDIAVYLAEKIGKETVILGDVMDAYTIKLESQEGLSSNEYLRNDPDFRLYSLNIDDFNKIVDLINEIKRE